VAPVPDTMDFMPGGPLPCCPASLARHLRDLGESYKSDFTLYKCLGCGRLWVHWYYEFTNTGGWKEVAAEDAHKFLHRRNMSFLREWASARGFD
jgi:hypothetical protein